MDKKTLPAVKVRRTRKVAPKGKSNSKGQEENKSTRHMVSDNEKATGENMTIQEKNPNGTSFTGKGAAVTDSQTKKEPKKRKQTRMTLGKKKAELPNGDRKKSLRSPGKKDEDAIMSPDCTNEGANGLQFPVKPQLPKIQAKAPPKDDSMSPQTSRAGDSLDPEMACRKEERPRSPQSPGRKKGLVQQPIYLKSAPSSPTTGQRSLHSPTNEDNKRLTKSSPWRRKAGFAFDTKNDGQDSSERRREALCSTTDMFGTERRSARIVRKKF